MEFLSLLFSILMLIEASTIQNSYQRMRGGSSNLAFKIPNAVSELLIMWSILFLVFVNNLDLVVRFFLLLLCLPFRFDVSCLDLL